MATTEQDYYELLGVARDASHAEIKRAFRRLARELHPDVNEEPDADRRFRAVAEAYEVLSDPERRRAYDRFGHAGVRGGFAPIDADFGSLSDVFAAFFGETLFGQAQRTGPRPTRGPDVAAQVEIDLADAARGISLDVGVRVARSCPTCDGSGAAPGTSPVACPGCGGSGVVQQVSRTVLGQIAFAVTPRSGALGRATGREGADASAHGGDQLSVDDRFADDRVDAEAILFDGHEADVGLDSFRKLDPIKRPVSAVADYTEIRDVVEVQIWEDRDIALTLLFDPEHNLEERILKEQFVP